MRPVLISEQILEFEVRVEVRRSNATRPFKSDNEPRVLRHLRMQAGSVTLRLFCSARAPAEPNTSGLLAQRVPASVVVARSPRATVDADCGQ